MFAPMHSSAAMTAWPFRKVLRHPLLEPFLHAAEESGPVCVGWGMKGSGQSAMRAARRDGGKLLLLEDAFVRSLKPGPGTVYGVLADSSGMHYDAAGATDLRTALETGAPAGWMREDDFNERPAAEVLERFRRLGVSKYNWFPDAFRDVSLPEKQGVLVVDQTRGDASIRAGGMGETDFDRMLCAAFEENTDSPVYLRGHPDHLHRAKKSCFSAKLLGDARIRLLSPDLPPAACFAVCPKVYAGSSLMGMEALIHGCRVVVFGAPFYAGRELTDDRSPLVCAGRAVGIEELFAQAYLHYCHYFDPDTRLPCGLWRILDHLELQQEMFRKNAGLTVTVGFDPWKKTYTAPYLRSPAGSVKHHKDFPDAETDAARLVVWGRKLEAERKLTRMEDGFLRSRGLGAAFHSPYSCVLDSAGIYFDGGSASDLETLLEGGFTDEQRERGARFARLLRDSRLTKYNLAGCGVSFDRKKANGRKVIFVPGQVEADASIRYGSPELKTNAALVRKVREHEPDAYIIHKIHPDIAACVRHGDLSEEELRKSCDEVVAHGNVLDWLGLCDEVHTMTSTAGFEALVRGVPVTTYGIPFYAGWGLTIDRIACPRRTRQLALDDLVYGAMIAYPRYVNPETGEFTTAEKVVALLASAAVPVDKRAWYLKTILRLKQAWVKRRREP